MKILQNGVYKQLTEEEVQQLDLIEEAQDTVEVASVEHRLAILEAAFLEQLLKSKE